MEEYQIKTAYRKGAKDPTQFVHQGNSLSFQIDEPGGNLRFQGDLGDFEVTLDGGVWQGSREIGISTYYLQFSILDFSGSGGPWRSPGTRRFMLAVIKRESDPPNEDDEDTETFTAEAPPPGGGED